MAVPNFQTIDMAHIREHSPTPTSDVKFTFVNQNSGEKLELYAHKFALAFGSEVFMTQFFGLLKEERDTIPVEDSSYDAFKILLDVLYNKKMSLDKTSFKLLAEVFYLTDKYLLAEMQEMVIQEVSSRKIVAGKLLEAAKVAEDNAHMEKFSMSLLKICATFVKEDIQSVLDIFNNEEAGGANSLILHRLMAKSSRIVYEPSVCKNCKQSPCLNGNVVTKDNFVIQAVVSNDPLPPKTKETCKFVVCNEGDDAYYVLLAAVAPAK